VRNYAAPSINNFHLEAAIGGNGYGVTIKSCSRLKAPGLGCNFFRLEGDPQDLG